ncbi:MAG: hypothetical protein E4G98_06990, partial [Promethearchaeota archaeon]
MIEDEFIPQFVSIYHDAVNLNAKLLISPEKKESKEDLNTRVFQALNSLLAYSFFIQMAYLRSDKIPTIFQSEKSTPFFFVNWNLINQFLCDYLQCTVQDLPNIFLVSPELLRSNIIFDNELVRKIKECFFSDSYKFLIDGFPDNKSTESKSTHITPLIFDHLYQMKILNSEQKIAHSGSYFSPISEINYTLFFSIYYFLIGNNHTQSDQEKSDIISYLGNLFFDSNGNNQSKSETISEDQKRIAVNIAQRFQNIHILDPTCGTGNFLVLFLHHILQIGRDSGEKDNILNQLSISGCDLRPWALKITQFRVWCLIQKFNFEENTQTFNFFQHRLTLLHCDFLTDLPKLPQFSMKYDFVIGNPPYIRHRDIKNPMKDSPSAN